MVCDHLHMNCLPQSRIVRDKKEGDRFSVDRKERHVRNNVDEVFRYSFVLRDPDFLIKLLMQKFSNIILEGASGALLRHPLQVADPKQHRGKIENSTRESVLSDFIHVKLTGLLIVVGAILIEQSRKCTPAAFVVECGSRSL